MGGKSSSQTIGFWYYLDLLAVLCHSPKNNPVSEVVEIQFAERTAWSGSITSSRTLGLYQRDLFGGEKREGGVEGQIDVMFGESNMSVNEYLGASLRAAGVTGAVPAYRGLLSLFFRGDALKNSEFANSPEFSLSGPETKPPPQSPWGFPDPPLPAFRWVALNPYPKKFKAKVRRYMQSWYPGKARIGDLANPIHTLYELYTDTEWGMSYPTSVFNDAKMRAAADQLYDEGFGIGITWSDGSMSIEDFALFIMNHISGLVAQDRTTGELYVKLIRDDYNTETVLQLDPGNFVLESYDRVSIGDAVNEVVVNFRLPDGTNDSVVEHDMAGINSQGRIVTQVIDMPGIRSAELASRVARRELNSRVSPLSKISGAASRVAYELTEGDVFKLVWPNEGISAAYYRVLEIDLGTLEDGKIQIQAVEDVFSLPDSSYSSPQTGGWVNPLLPPTASPERYITEIPYYDLIRSLNDDPSSLGEGDTFLEVYARAPASNYYNYELWTATGTTELINRAAGGHTPTAVLTQDLPLEEFSTVSVDSFAALSGHIIEENMTIMIGGEYMRIDDVDMNALTVSVARGVHDTVPKNHASGATVFFTSLDAGHDSVAYLQGDSVKVKIQTVNALGTLTIASAPQDTYVMTGRAERPYAPGKLRINGAAYPESISNTLALTWAGRNRLSQTADIIDQSVATITPELNAHFVLSVKGENGAYLIQDLELDSYAYTLSQTDEYLNNRVTYHANRDLRSVGLGLTSGGQSDDIKACQTRVQDGWMGVTFVSLATSWARFVNTLLGTKIDRNFSTGFNTYSTSVGFTLNGMVYTTSDTYDQTDGWTVKIGASAPFDTNYSTLSSVDSILLQPIRDRRPDAACAMFLTSKTFALWYWVTNSSNMRVIHRDQFIVHRVKKSQVVGGNLIPDRTVLTDYYRADMNQFNNAEGWYGAKTLVVANDLLGAGGMNVTACAHAAVIFGNLMYMPCVKINISDTTSGKPVSILNALNAHLTIATSGMAITNIYTINADGDISYLAERVGHCLADQVSAVTGVEVFQYGIRSVNITTGASGGQIASIPSQMVPTNVVGDPSSETFYVVYWKSTTQQAFIYRYNLSGTVLASLELTGIQPSASDNNTLTVTSNQVYFGFGNQTNGNGGKIYRINKDLSGYSTTILSALTGVSGQTAYSVISNHDSSDALAVTSSVTTGVNAIKDTSLLLNDGGSSTAVPQVDSPRINNELTIELGSTREGFDSHDKHEVSVTRTGWNMRWGRYN